MSHHKDNHATDAVCKVVIYNRVLENVYDSKVYGLMCIQDWKPIKKEIFFTCNSLTLYNDLDVMLQTRNVKPDL